VTSKSGGRNCDEGFTLIEVIVAMFVLAIVMLAILFVQARALTTNADSSSRQAATAYANEAMEQLRAMPWNYLRKGLYSGWNAGSTDPFTTGTTLIVDGKSYTLRVGSTGSDQDLSNPWPPLFDATGSNVQTLTSGSGNGDTVTLRAYTTEDQAGQSSAVGLVVVATWGKRTDGSQEQTVLTSTAYAPSAGCGDLNNAPFLASCQAQFEANSSSARVDISATATSEDGSAEAPLLEGLSFYSFQVSSGSASSRVTSQQVSNTSSFASLGGSLWDDNINSTSPTANGWTAGGTQVSVRASDDTTAGAAPANPGTTSASGTNSSHTFTSGLFDLYGRSDDGRTASVFGTADSGCATGLTWSIPADSPCATASVGGTNASQPIMTLDIDGRDLELTRSDGDLSDVYDRAWSARFTTASGNASVGCQTVSGSGCTSAGAQQGIDALFIGDVKQTNQWDGGAWAGLVNVIDYTDSVRVERGVNSTSTAPAFSRSATIYYWDGTDYEDLVVGPNTADSVTIPETTWDAGDAVITATGSVLVTGASSTTSSTTDCIGGDGCIVDASNGTISVSITYAIVPASGTPWNLTVKTTITGSQAGARFEESPNA